MKRVIKDYKNLSPEHELLIAEHFPDGFENEHLVSFTTPKGEFIKALEIRTSDTIYLFKVDKNMKVDDEENQENESLVMSEFENFKDDDEEEEEENKEDRDEITGDGGESAADTDDD